MPTDGRDAPRPDEDATTAETVSDLSDRLLDDPSLARHFAGVDLRSLINHQTQFIAFVTGGPGVSYSDEALARVHHPLGITREEVKQMRALGLSWQYRRKSASIDGVGDDARSRR